MDHTKLGRESVLPLCDLDCIDTIVTDSAASSELIESLRANEIQVIVANAGSALSTPPVHMD
jgi:DeoR/GlpR family transcriptional regulator of sugar metabolism